MICKSGDVVIVPFLFTDSAKAKPRPALVISTPSFNATHRKALLLMITTASHTQWPSDVPIGHPKSCGLKNASSVRMKCFTVETHLIKRHIGHMHRKDWASVKKRLHQVIAL